MVSCNGDVFNFSDKYSFRGGLSVVYFWDDGHVFGVLELEGFGFLEVVLFLGLGLHWGEFYCWHFGLLVEVVGVSSLSGDEVVMRWWVRWFVILNLVGRDEFWWYDSFFLFMIDGCIIYNLLFCDNIILFDGRYLLLFLSILFYWFIGKISNNIITIYLKLIFLFIILLTKYL
jgi:hypothetical protein